MVIEVGLRTLTRKGSSEGMRLTVQRTKNWKDVAMNVLELLQMRAAVLSPGTKTRLRLAQDKLNFVRWMCMRRKERRLGGIRTAG